MRSGVLRYALAIQAIAMLLAIGSSMVATAATVVSAAAGYAGIPSTNCYGDAGNGEIEVVYNTYSCDRRGIVEFAVPVGTLPVSSAIVTLFDGGVGNAERAIWPIDVYGYAGDGAVTGSDYVAGTFITTVYWDRWAEGADVFAFDLTSYVNAQLATGVPVIGLNLRPADPYYCPSCGNAFIFFDGAGGDRPPTLQLQAVPIPGAAVLFASSLLLLGRLRGEPR